MGDAVVYSTVSDSDESQVSPILTRKRYPVQLKTVRSANVSDMATIDTDDSRFTRILLPLEQDRSNHFKYIASEFRVDPSPPISQYPSDDDVSNDVDVASFSDQDRDSPYKLHPGTTAATTLSMPKGDFSKTNSVHMAQERIRVPFLNGSISMQIVQRRSQMQSAVTRYRHNRGVTHYSELMHKLQIISFDNDSFNFYTVLAKTSLENVAIYRIFLKDTGTYVSESKKAKMIAIAEPYYSYENIGEIVIFCPPYFEFFY